ncbi:MAG: heme exporter protein CcmB [Gammaproteobacteria bacterium]|nr:heme exporter protein CcmB [Gammaproteobacteria bacterium]|tara:strand:+ start:2223 stop:2891 length:669 start_codon:yes stop_codon:yes gene_type:complete
MIKIVNIMSKELLLASRSGYETFMPIVYLILIMTFFNVAISYVSNDIIVELVPLMIWVSCLLICILNLETVFKDDFDDGSLELFIIHSGVIEFEILAKIFAHWVLSNLPVVIIAPLIALGLGVTANTSLILFLSLLVGTPSMSLIGAIAAALTVSLRKNKILISLMVLPLYLPILIFATSAVSNSYFNLNYETELLMLVILLLIFILIAPLACNKALRISLD